MRECNSLSHENSFMFPFFPLRYRTGNFNKDAMRHFHCKVHSIAIFSRNKTRSYTYSRNKMHMDDHTLIIIMIQANKAWPHEIEESLYPEKKLNWISCKGERGRKSKRECFPVRLSGHMGDSRCTVTNSLHILTKPAAKNHFLSLSLFLLLSLPHRILYSFYVWAAAVTDSSSSMRLLRLLPLFPMIYHLDSLSLPFSLFCSAAPIQDKKQAKGKSKIGKPHKYLNSLLVPTHKNIEKSSSRRRKCISFAHILTKTKEMAGTWDWLNTYSQL